MHKRNIKCQILKNLEKPGFKSKLSKYNNEIYSLFEDGYTVKQIHKYLIEMEKVEVSLDYVYKYIRKLNIKELAKEISSNSKSEPKQKEQEKQKDEDEKPKVDPFEALRKSLEEDRKNGTTTRREVPYWEPKNSRVRDWDKGTLMDPDA